MFVIRVTAPVYPQQPYAWGVQSEGQCTWGAYYRCGEALGSYPCWWDRETQSGSYTDAKYWLENYRDPWQVKDTNYTPVAGDIAVFDGNYGHVVFIEKMEGKVALISDWNRVAPLTYASSQWNTNTGLSGCGKLLGYLHYPYHGVEPVPRNTEENQIETTDLALRIRNKPNLQGDIIGHVKIGYYNVLSTTGATKADKEQVEGLECWYEIDKGLYCANITTLYLPKGDDSEIIKKLKEYIESMEHKIAEKDKENSQLIQKLNDIHEISEV